MLKSLILSSLIGIGALGLTHLAHADETPKPRAAKCLLEIKGAHYFGGQCEFAALDHKGSFRISDPQSGFTAEVDVTQPNEGRASWSAPRGTGTSPHVDRERACWDDDHVLLCAWDMDHDVYLGPTPPEPKDSSVIYWGSRVGTFDNIASRTGTDTEHAQLVTSPSRDGVIIYCRTYAQDYSNKCIRDGFKGDRPKTATGNCVAKTFTSFDGGRYQFLGRNRHKYNGDKPDAMLADYLIKDRENGTILDGSTASSYDIEFDIFKSLCPAAVTHSEKEETK